MAKLFDPGAGRQRVDRYELVGEIASGGMATVYLARLTGVGGFQRFVAMKRLHPHLASEKEFVEMFLDEARIAARIHHPNVVPILEVGPGFEPQLLEQLACGALVLSLPGGGHISDATPAVLERIAAKFPVVFASRTGGGETLEQSYAYPGSEVDLLARGLVAAGPLDARKARVALAILLSNGAGRREIAAFFGSL